MIEAIALSNVGNIRSSNEDNYLLGKDKYIDKSIRSAMINNYYTSKHRFRGNEGIFAVCDGMGGHLSGETASYESIMWLNDHYDKIICDMENAVLHIAELNRYIYRYALMDKKFRNMGTTLSAVIAYNRRLCFINAGDSRIYRFSNDKLTQLTNDHTEGQRLMDLRLLTKDECMKFPSRKALYKYIGREGELVADVNISEAKDNEYYMICSDGVSDTLPDTKLEELFKNENNIDAIGKRIIDSALDMGSECCDNVTVIILNVMSL